MGKRLDRLRQPKEFAAGLSTRPVGRSGVFLVHVTRPQDRFRLGFILPKRFVRKAVLRNLIKRWAREIFRRELCSSPDFCNVIVRIRQPLDTTEWISRGRKETRDHLYMALRAVNQK
jgi:ribonuclease P protein component